MKSGSMSSEEKWMQPEKWMQEKEKCGAG